MKHALILRLLNVPLFTALFGSLVMIGLDTMQGDKTANAKRASAASRHNDSPPTDAVAETGPPIETETVDVAVPHYRPTVNPERVPQLKEMLTGNSDADPPSEVEVNRVVDEIVSDDDPHEPDTDGTRTSVVSSTTGADEDVTSLTEPADTTQPAEPARNQEQQEEFDAKLATALPDGDPVNDRVDFPADFPADIPADSLDATTADSDASLVEVDPSSSGEPRVAEGILRRRAERQRRLAERVRAAAEERRRQTEIEQTAASAADTEESEEPLATDPGTQVVSGAEDATEDSATLPGEIRLSNSSDNQVDVIFLLGQQIRRLAPGQTTIINQATTVRFDRGGSFGAATEQLVLGRSYEFQVNARGWSVVRNPTVGNAATE